MRILMLTTNTSLIDGINRHILTVASALNRLKDVDVAVCTAQMNGEFNEALDREGVVNYSLGCDNGHQFKALPRFRRILKDFNPDVIHCHVVALMERVILAYSLKKYRLVTTIHGITDRKNRLSFRTRLENAFNWLFPLSYSAVCYISNGVKDRLASSFDVEILSAVCYNPLSFSTSVAKRGILQQRLGLPENTPMIGTACRVAAVKNPEAFTEVMCKVLQADPAVHAVVMGNGEEAIMKRCKTIVSGYEMSDRFHWMGYVKDAPVLVPDLSCFVMTSHSEGMPTSVLECFVARTPVAMMEGKGGLRDIASMHMKYGDMVLLSTSGDTDGMAAKIIEVVKNKDKGRMIADNAFNVARRYFDVNSVAMQLVDIYTKVLKL